MKNWTRIMGLSCAASLCMMFQACTSHSAEDRSTITLQALDGVSLDDSMVVSGTLPGMRVRKDALHHIQDHHGIGQCGIIPIPIRDVTCPEYKIIPLETKEDCLMGGVHDIVKDDSLLFVMDWWAASIFVFDLDGKFVRRICHKGHAKDEYVSMRQVSFDRKNKRMCVYDKDSQKLVFYDYQGKFTGREPLYFEFWSLAFADDGRRVLLTPPYRHGNYPELDNYRLTVTDEKGRPQCGALPNMGFPDRSQLHCAQDNDLHSYPDGVYYIDFLSPDTIWRVGKKECVPFLAADFGEPFTTVESYRGMNDEAYNKKTNEAKYLYDDFVLTKDFGYLSMSGSGHVVINFKTGNYLTGNLDKKPGEPDRNFMEYTYESIYNGQVFLYDWENNQVVKVWEAAELKKRLKMTARNDGWKKVYDSWPQSDRDILDRITPEDNPVLVVATFKKF